MRIRVNQTDRAAVDRLAHAEKNLRSMVISALVHWCIEKMLSEKPVCPEEVTE